jgi:murein tripeptide amidase MpaA
MSLRTFYELSFEVEFKGEEEVRFAYCIPYTYSDLLRDLKEISSVAEVGVMGQSLTGVDIPIVLIGEHEAEKNKPVLILTGRIHPAESNGSLILSSLMKHLCFSPEAKYIR